MNITKRFLAAFAALAFAHSIQAGDGSLTFSPTAFPDATVNESYEQSVTITSDMGISSPKGVSGLPSGLSARSAVKGSALTLTVQGKPTVKGTFTITVTVMLGDRSTTSGLISLTVKDGSGGGGVTTPTLERNSPSTASVSMTVGDKQNFKVTAKDIGSATLYWYEDGSNAGCTGAEFEYSPSSAGSHTVECRAMQMSGSGGVVTLASVSWNVAVSAPATTFSPKSPASQNVSMSVGKSQAFEVEASGSTEGISYSWSASPGSGSGSVPVVANGLSCTFTPPAGGTYVVRFTYGSSSQVAWVVTVSAPTVEFSPSGTSVVIQPGERPTFNVIVKNATSDVLYRWWRGDDEGSLAPASTGTDSNAAAYQYIPSHSGAQLLRAVASSADGKTEYGSHTWTVTTDGPRIVSVTPYTNSVEMVKGEKRNFTVTLDKTDYEQLTYNWDVELSENSWWPFVNAAGATRSYTFDGDDKGIKVTIYANGVNCGTQTWSLVPKASEVTTLERLTPVQADVTMVAGGMQTFRVIGEERNAYSNYYWYVDGKAMSAGYKYYPYFPGVSNGVHTIECKIQADAEVNGGEELGEVQASTYWTVTVAEPEDPPLFEREAPLTPGVYTNYYEDVVFNVKANGDTSGVDYHWVVSSEQDLNAAFRSSSGLTATLRPAREGIYYVSFVYGANRSIQWAVTVGTGTINSPTLARVDPVDEDAFPCVFRGETKTFTVADSGKFPVDTQIYWGWNLGSDVDHNDSLRKTAPITDEDSHNFEFATGGYTEMGVHTVYCYAKKYGADLDKRYCELSWYFRVQEMPVLTRIGADTEVKVNVGEPSSLGVRADYCKSKHVAVRWYVNGQLLSEQTGEPIPEQTASYSSKTFTPSIKGNYAVECKAETRNTDGSWRTLSTVAWTVRAIYGEKAYIPVPLPDSEVLGEVFAHRVSLKPGEFSKPITMAGGVAGYSEFNVIGSLPAGVTLSSGGVLSGTMNDDLNGEEIQLELVFSSQPPIVNTFTNRVTLTLVKRVEENRMPYFSFADPADAAIDCYIGVPRTFNVYAYDEEEENVTYKWFLDGDLTPVQTGTYTFNDSNAGHVGMTRSICCCATDRNPGYVFMKEWTVTMRQPEFAIATTTLSGGTVGDPSGAILLDYIKPSNTTVVALDVVDGKLPPGWTPLSFGTSDSFIAGKFRKAGSYTFTLRATCSNGETAEQTYTVNVGGTDDAPKTWKVEYSGGGTIKPTKAVLLGKGEDTYASITQTLQQGVAEGDTIEVYSTNPDMTEELSAFKYLKGVNVLIKGNLIIDAGKKVPDVSMFTLDGGSLRFKLAGQADGYYGDKVVIATIGKGKSVGDYTIYNNSLPYYTGELAVDDDGNMYTRTVCVKYNDSDDRLNLADDITRRDVTFSGTTFSKRVTVASEGVLPGSVVFAGSNILAEDFTLPALDDVKTVVKSGATIEFGNGASLGDSRTGGIELEAGATLRFNPNGSGPLMYGVRMKLPKTGKVNLALTGAMEVGKSFNISSRYVGDNDPMNVFEIVQTSSAVAYRLYRGGENALVLAAETAPNPGELIWTESVDMGGTLGGSFSHTFAATAKDVSPRTGYSDFTYSLLNSAYTATRTEDKTFNASVGERELLQGAYRYGGSASAAPVEIGFPFPCGPSFVSTVKVSPSGRITIGDAQVNLLDKGLLADIQNTYAHVYVARSEDAFTVRYDRFASLTLTPDGKIRVAFGPDADELSVNDPQVALCYMTAGGNRIDFSSAEPYAGSNDILLEPVCPPGLTLSSTGVLSGRPLLAGDYSLDVKVTAKDSFSNTYTMTRTFNLSIAGADISEPTTTVIEAPDVADDGYVHLLLGGTANFEVSVEGGDGMRWMLDGICVSSTGKYTLTAPATRSLNAVDARIHRLAVETTDGVARKVWYVVYNRKVYVDANSTASAGGGSSSGGGDGAAGGGSTIIIGEDGSIITGGGGEGGTGGGTTADGLTSETAFADFQEGMFRYLLNGDEVIVAPGTYSTPIDFYNNDAKVTVSATGATLDLFGNTKGYTRCFRQGRYEVMIGRSGSPEVIFMPINEAAVTGLTLCGGAVSSDVHGVGGFSNSSVNYYGVVGGGVFGGTFENCVITGCEAKDYGGGAYGAVLNHCIVEDCSAAVGGGCANCELSYCTVVGNVATSAAGGVDGECEAYYSIILGNEAAGKANEYAATTTPVKLTPQVPTIDNCFTDGDPLFCADYHLASGSPAEGKGAYPTPDATECLVFVEIVGGGTVSPNEIGGNVVGVGENLAFTTSGRDVEAIYVNGNAVDSPANSWTLENVTANTTVRFVFGAATLRVGATRELTTISSAVAVAGSGDTITVDAGTYEETIDVRGFAGTLTIEAANPAAKPVVDAKGAGRCVTAVAGSDKVVFRNLVLANGMAEMVSSGALPYAEWFADGIHSYTDAQLLDFGFGGGVFGGRYENCVITNCTAIGTMGGGAFRATLVGCEVAGNSAGQKLDSDIYRDLCGGGVFGGLVKDCRVHGNSLVGYRNQVYCRYRGAGTFGAEVRNSFVWDNYINCGSVESAIPNETDTGSDGITVHTVEKAPTPTQLENHRTPIPVDGETPTYATREAAEAAAAKQVADIPTPVARAISNHDAYVNLFEIRTVEDGNGGFVNKTALKESVLETIHEQAMDALTTDDSGEPRASFQVQKMEKTLTNTIPGLYYALEFSSDLSNSSFVGERHLSTGSGSMKLSATSLNTPSGFWRMAVYLSPDGE